MVYLITDAMAAGVALGGLTRGEVRAPYATLEEAMVQAEHDLMLGRTPLRIEDGETREVLWEPDKDSSINDRKE